MNAAQPHYLPTPPTAPTKSLLVVSILIFLVIRLSIRIVIINEPIVLRRVLLAGRQSRAGAATRPARRRRCSAVEPRAGGNVRAGGGGGVVRERIAGVDPLGVDIDGRGKAWGRIGVSRCV